MSGTCNTHGKDKYFSIFVCKPEWKKRLGSLRYRWEHSIEVDVKEVE
jgi:hypothetical protein